jgi:pimeloyl-ACP methyl ester carboxylesterase
VRARVALPGRAAEGVDVTIDRALVARTLYALLLSVPTRQQLPLLLHRAATRGLATLAPMAAQVQAAVYTQVPAGLYLSVVCAEDAPGITDADQRALARTAVGATGDIRAACRAWPGAAREADRQDAAPPAGRAAVAWAGPALLLSGAADPATDAAGAERLARAWPQARHVVLPATAHGPLLPGCARDLVVAFVDQAEAAGLDAACLRTITWPAFATGVAAR